MEAQRGCIDFTALLLHDLCIEKPHLALNLLILCWTVKKSLGCLSFDFHLFGKSGTFCLFVFLKPAFQADFHTLMDVTGVAGNRSGRKSLLHVPLWWWWELPNWCVSEQSKTHWGPFPVSVSCGFPNRPFGRPAAVILIINSQSRSKC